MNKHSPKAQQPTDDAEVQRFDGLSVSTIVDAMYQLGLRTDEGRTAEAGERAGRNVDRHRHQNIQSAIAGSHQRPICARIGCHRKDDGR